MSWSCAALKDSEKAQQTLAEPHGESWIPNHAGMTEHELLAMTAPLYPRNLLSPETLPSSNELHAMTSRKRREVAFDIQTIRLYY